MRFPHLRHVFKNHVVPRISIVRHRSLFKYYSPHTVYARNHGKISVLPQESRRLRDVYIGPSLVHFHVSVVQDSKPTCGNVEKTGGALAR